MEAAIFSRRTRTPQTLRAAALTAAGAVTLGLLTIVPGSQAALADTKAPRRTATVSADALSTWQINGVVWDTVTVGDTVYATGQFTQARPPGATPGAASSVDRENLVAIDIRTGKVTSFHHDLNGVGKKIVASPDGSTIYVGGRFTQVDGVDRSYVAAFDTGTGDLTDFAPVLDNVVSAIAVSSSAVYLAGNFTHVNGDERTDLAAVDLSGTSTQRWAPAADDWVFAMVMAPTGKSVILGGQFQTINGRKRVGVGAVSAVTGGSTAWKSNPVPARKGKNFSTVTDLVVSGSTVFGTAAGSGKHWFDGRFAARAANGSLIWLDNCYGATYSAFVSGSVLYSVGHAHDCSSLGAFPDTSKPRTWHRALAETTYATGHDRSLPGTNSSYRKQPVPTLLHWFPTLNSGSFTGQHQSAWAVTGNSGYVVLAGEFTKVNGRAQQGLTRYATAKIAPNKIGPMASASLRPKLADSARGGVLVSWKKTWDEDNARLRYTILRDGKAVGHVDANSSFWSLGSLTWRDAKAKRGSHSYRIVVQDPFKNKVTSAASTIKH